MKKNSVDIFVQPRRQSHFAIIFIVLRVVKNLLKQLWPLLLAVVLGRRGSSSLETFELAITGLGVLGIIPSIISYYKYYFHLSENELVINKGLLKKVKLNIPFERIQSVNFRQSFIHQFLKVTEVEIETAGSSDQETKIDALDVHTAELLRTRILEMKDRVNGSDQVFDSEQGTVQDANQETILTLSNHDLFRVGLTQNHLQPVGLLIGVISTIYFYSYSLDIDVSGIISQIFNFVQDIQSLNLLSIVISILLLIIAAVIYSIVTTVLRHYKLHFWRSGSKFQIVQGLLTRREFTALDNKIQILKWGQNPFERLMGFYNITFSQAKSGDKNEGTSTFQIPGCSEEEIEYVRKMWLGKPVVAFDHLHGVSPHLFYHSASYQVMACMIIGGANLWIGSWIAGWVVLMIPLVTVYLTWLHYKKKRYGYNESDLYVGGGTVGLRHALLPLYKIQNVSISQSPYQWRRRLATLVVHTAGGSIRVPYISHHKALEIMNELVCRVEMCRQPWM